ncbi:hypothetical protein LINPERHAP2_LOCUS10813 [Linum perenne]
MHELINGDWKVKLSRIYGEGNKVVDLLAQHGHGLDWGTHLKFSLSHDIELAILSDCIRVTN